ncbi:GNAT family N-acetyltransferase [Oscillochloris sp. ZM17-4]|uniref:GNAT family N-acetyltransferase n=1 Tax=Oscillochloris sp. ZM17-4 TaxID=2866714 RepID=UPI001C72A4E3|nr:GNAT family N-acetyltransferase [Oscillochloris sp. ZM17-4]MBX0326982.1 GNAT family N-acetyltransferase [Oscillochloris sp. ZM17-4]
MVMYQNSLTGVDASHLQGFFVGWPSPPAPATHLRILAGSSHVVLAREGERGPVVGFITAVSDGVSCAYIPHLEVLPGHQGRGVGSELLRRMLAALRQIYMIDLICDADVQPFYERLGMRPYSGMILRNYDRQSGE